jgi:hypothetical protein
MKSKLPSDSHYNLDTGVLRLFMSMNLVLPSADGGGTELNHLLDLLPCPVLVFKRLSLAPRVSYSLVNHDNTFTRDFCCILEGAFKTA